MKKFFTFLNFGMALNWNGGNVELVMEFSASSTVPQDLKSEMIAGLRPAIENDGLILSFMFDKVVPYILPRPEIEGKHWSLNVYQGTSGFEESLEKKEE